MSVQHPNHETNRITQGPLKRRWLSRELTCRFPLLSLFINSIWTRTVLSTTWRRKVNADIGRTPIPCYKSKFSLHQLVLGNWTISLGVSQLTAELKTSLTPISVSTLGKIVSYCQPVTRSGTATQQPTWWWTGNLKLVMIRSTGSPLTGEFTWLATLRKIFNSRKNKRSFVRKVTHLLGVLILTFTGKSGSKVSVSSESYRLVVTAAAVTTWLYQVSKCMGRSVTEDGLESEIYVFFSI